MLRQPGEDVRDLRRSLALSENHLGHARAQGAMMVDLGKVQVFKGHMAKTINPGVGREFAPAHLLEKFADGFGVHGGTQQSALGTQPSAV
jgi:hypothetical protein